MAIPKKAAITYYNNHVVSQCRKTFNLRSHTYSDASNIRISRKFTRLIPASTQDLAAVVEFDCAVDRDRAVICRYTV